MLGMDPALGLAGLEAKLSEQLDLHFAAAQEGALTSKELFRYIRST